MSEEKLLQLLTDLFNQEISVDEVFEELECVIDFSEHYEGE